MDPLQSKEFADSENSQKTTSVTKSDAEVWVQLQGSHTTSTETDGTFDEYKKNVTFQDDHDTEKLNLSQEENSVLKENVKENNKPGDHCRKFLDENKHLAGQEENLSMTRKIITENYLEQQGPQQNIGKTESQNTNVANDETFKNRIETEAIEDQSKIQNISKERKEVSQRLEHIIDMFDNFSKNLETLDLQTKQKIIKQAATGRSAAKRPLKEQQMELQLDEPVIDHIKAVSDQQNNQGARKLPLLQTVMDDSTASAAEIEHLEDYLKHQKMTLNELENEAKAMKAIQGRSVSTATSNCEFKTFGCQTQFADHISLNTIDLVDVSSLASRTEQPNSLNNFATADNACIPYYGSQQDITKRPLSQQPFTTPAVIVQEVPRFSVITIEADATPSSIDLRRKPFWQRVWEVIGDFCAATFLCLQVNRDCIFCLGFIVAFVASVSFLTAFFYHTIILSPTLWQTEDSFKF